MKVVTDSNETIDLGVTETSPTISITDYSRRVTDSFGVTTVVPRAFSRKLSVRMLLATSAVDSVQRRLAGLRATPARWVASDDLTWLAVRGFFKDFEIEVADARNSFCTLSVEGLAETETVADNGVEPAPTGSVSSLRLLQPVAVTDSTLVSSTVSENDYPAWSGATSYSKGTRVVRGTTHRIYESAVDGNLGNDPAGSSGRWTNIGPTNRWAMFDEALGTATTASGSLSVVLSGSATNAIALVDVIGASVRVQASSYDRTQAAGAGAIVFADLPNVTGQITVTITGSGAVAVGTLLIGRVVGLGITEASPTAGITDYSRKEVDDFGAVTVVQRAWAKRMSARALIRTDAVDQVANRIATVRARPCLWIADSALDSVTLYGFFKDFSIEVGERVSKLSLSIEGLSKAAPIATALPDAGELTPRGNYDPAVTYSEGDVVQYDGSSWYYIAQDPSSGHAPPLLPTTENAYWRVFAQGGRNGENAPLVLVQWSVDGMTNWHANYVNGDLYQRQSNDNGATWGPAVRVVGEAAGAGADGISPSIIFRRLASVPATPQQDTGNPPPGWSDAPPAGTDLLWQSVSKFRGGVQLEPWSTPVRITGPAGASAFMLNTDGGVVWSGNEITKATGTDGWNAQAYSTAGYRNGAAATFRSATGSHALMAGLNDDPASSNSFPSLNYAWYLRGDGRAEIYESGAQAVNPGNPSDPYVFVYDYAFGLFQVVCTGRTIRYLYQGAVYREIGVPEGQTLFFDSSFLAVGGKLLDVTFVPGGADGRNGVDGLPGEDGADGITYYPYYAYANAPDGSVDFTLGQPGTRAYVGFAVGTSASEPTLPEAYAWSEYKGPPFGMATRGFAVVAARQLIKNGGPNDWESDAFSTTGFRNGAVASFQFVPGGAMMAGLNTDPTADASYISLDYAWHVAQNSSGLYSQIYESGVGKEVFGGFAATTKFQVHYDGRYVRYLRDGAVVATREPGGGIVFYFDSSLYTPGSRITDIDFAAAGASGSDGVDGLDGIAIDPNVASITFEATYAGVLKAGQINKTAKLILRRGTADISTSAAWAIAGVYGAQATISGDGTISFSSVTGAGYVDATATFGGKVYPKRVPFSFQKDQAPPQTSYSQTAPANGQLTSTTFAAVPYPVVTLTPNAQGQINAIIALGYNVDNYQGGTRQANVEAKAAYRALGTTTWSDFGAGAATGQPSVWTPQDKDPGGLSATIVQGGLDPSKTYDIGLFMRLVGTTAGTTATVDTGTFTGRSA